jgi:hypothetical protein
MNVAFARAGASICWRSSGGSIATGTCGEISSDLHNATAVKVGQVLKKRFPHLRFSVKFFGWLPDFLPVAQAEG